MAASSTNSVALTDGAVIGVDGKTVRRSHDRGAGKTAAHMASVWAGARHLVFGQVKGDEKSNDAAQRAPAALPALLDVRLLKGYIVTIDAMGYQAEIAAQIIDRARATCSHSKSTRGRYLVKVLAG